MSTRIHMYVHMHAPVNEPSYAAVLYAPFFLEEAKMNPGEAQCAESHTSSRQILYDAISTASPGLRYC